MAVGSGRAEILTAQREVTDDNVIEIIKKALPVFRSNARDCQFLLDYELGKQPLQRKTEKKVMTWIDYQNVDNVAKEITDFWSSFADGNPITVIQRGDISENEKKAEGVKLLNDCYASSGNVRAIQKMSRFKQITGIVYTLIEINKDWEEGESYFTRDVIDPRNAFVVRSLAYPDRRVILGVTFSLDEHNNMIYMTAYSKDRQYELIGRKKEGTGKKVKDFEKDFLFVHTDESKQKNPLGRIQLCEWVRSEDRTGVFEAQINACDNLNLLSSDISNGIDQGIQSFIWANDIELEEQEVTYTNENGETVTEKVFKKPGAGDWLTTRTPQNGSKPQIQPLTVDYHIAEMVNNYLSQRSLVLQKCHVPQRNDNSGGSTGLATETASGWAEAENIAMAQECITVGCQLDEYRVVLSAIKESPDIEDDNPMLDLKVSDIEPCVRRPKNFEISTKVNAFCALISKGVSIEDSLAVAPIVPDSAQFVTRSGDGIRLYQETNVWNADNSSEETEKRPFPDNSDQISNSPNVDGIKTGELETVDE